MDFIWSKSHRSDLSKSERILNFMRYVNKTPSLLVHFNHINQDWYDIDMAQKKSNIPILFMKGDQDI
jgi:hypothetical protein